jgi:amidase
VLHPELGSLTVAQLAGDLAAGRRTSRSLFDAHLARIEELDGAFGSVRSLASDARRAADESDARRRAGGPTGALEGIPVLVKDSIDVAGLPTTVGALALERSVPGADAPLVARLRAAGAVIVGKTNLSELCNFLTNGMPSGYSSLGGQVLNPYDTALTPSGSSSGSAAAVALGLVPVAVGTETDGSVTSPAEHQSLVGMKPTVGLVSRTGLFPISPVQDTAGPLARTVADAAALLAAMAGPDPLDDATIESAATAAALAALRLGGDALRGVRLGLVAPSPQGAGEGEAVHPAARQALEEAGAELIDVTLPALGQDDELVALHYEFAPAVDRYLAALGAAAPVRTLSELAGWNREHAAAALKFGQTHVDAALAVDHEAGRLAYDELRARDAAAVTAALEGALGDGLEALVFARADGASLAARVGWPSIVLPAGYGPANRRPVGVMLVSRPWSDARLLALADALERALPVRRPPWEINPAAFRSLL